MRHPITDVVYNGSPRTSSVLGLVGGLAWSRSDNTIMQLFDTPGDLSGHTPNAVDALPLACRRYRCATFPEGTWNLHRQLSQARWWAGGPSMGTQGTLTGNTESF